MALLRSVNVGMPKVREWAGIGRTSIDKRPVEGPVVARTLGLDGDQVSDTQSHGGVDQAVYAFAREDLDWWQRELRLEDGALRDGQFGENLTTEGIDVNEALIGERWAIGSALFEVASVRIPCRDFKNWQRVTGFDDRGWVKRFTAVGRPGPYLRVLEEGEIEAGQRIEVVDRPDHDVTVSVMFAALTTRREWLPRLLEVPAMPQEARDNAERHLGDRSSAGDSHSVDR
jgi:MOSC domain-containing protein YiiM